MRRAGRGTQEAEPSKNQINIGAKINIKSKEMVRPARRVFEVKDRWRQEIGKDGKRM